MTRTLHSGISLDPTPARFKPARAWPIACLSNIPALTVQQHKSCHNSEGQSLDHPFVQTELLTNFTPAGAEHLFCRTNPTAYIFPNGTTLLYFRSAESNGENEQIWLAIAPSYEGPYTLHSTQAVLPTSNSPLIGGLSNEDPFIFRNNRGRFILMMHMSHWGAGWNGAKAYSYDGITWHWSSQSMSRVWNSTINYVDGSTVLGF